MFNLAAMHHFGDGLDQDLHLAKRYYDLALSTSSEAFVSQRVGLGWRADPHHGTMS